MAQQQGQQGPPPTAASFGAPDMVGWRAPRVDDWFNIAQSFAAARNAFASRPEYFDPQAWLGQFQSDAQFSPQTLTMAQSMARAARGPTDEQAQRMRPFNTPPFDPYEWLRLYQGGYPNQPYTPLGPEAFTRQQQPGYPRRVNDMNF